jgi:dipeptidyl aminopeptidase/acylaminoacyl peptidase
MDDKVEYRYFDPERQSLQAGLEKAFPSTSVVAASTDITLKTAIVATDSPKNGISYYYLDRSTHHADPIIAAYPQLQPSDLGEMKPYSFRARDGLTVPGYLTLPPDKAAKNLPLVVFPHGGPQARTALSFEWYVQFLANRGYAVFEPNFRGSTGYGKAFMEKGYRQWGGAMQDDISDGVKALIADGTADPNRICIAGISYGGYAALAGAAFTPDLYKCAISIAGVSDVRQMVKTDMAGMLSNSPLGSHLAAEVGDSSRDEAYLDSISPALHAERIRIPVLLMHGTGDATVQFAQSEEMREALKRAGHPPSFVTFDSDDHALSLPATRIQMLHAMETFIDKNIGN